MPVRRTMTLTPELIARVHRDMPDPGPPPGTTALTDADYAGMVRDLLAAAPGGSDIWVFACGSLIWKPAFIVDEQRPALLHGWHRQFCIRLVGFRGSPDCPGLMMGLERGGACRGVIQRVPAIAAPERLEQLLRREMSIKPATNQPRWVAVESAGERRRAIAITVDRAGYAYAGRHDVEETAKILARACGHWGSGAEYLMHTVAHLEALGIHDRYLWELQRRVGEKISAMTELAARPSPGGR
jgi:glutathione-specific gamma-glutamylcyclotransferase